MLNLNLEHGRRPATASGRDILAISVSSCITYPCEENFRRAVYLSVFLSNTYMSLVLSNVP